MTLIILIGSKVWLLILRPLITYIETIEIRAIECVRKGYTLPTKFDRGGNIILKFFNENSNVEIQYSSFNYMVLNAIINEVDINQYDLISACTTAKNAWDILQDILNFK